MNTATCSLCVTSEEIPAVPGFKTDLPPLWSHITIAERGNQIRNFTLCLSCTAAVRAKMGALGAAYRDGLVKK